MKRPSVHDIVFTRQFPKPKQSDPQNFYAHVQRHLVPEVRVEVQTFYGALDSLEAQYPGLNYTYEPHRRRLGRFPWHRRLFRIFDELKLTHDEILSICQWEGTKSAKDKYEAETGRKIRDTTADGVIALPKSQPSATVHWRPRRQPSTETMAHIGALDEQNSDIDQSDVDELNKSIGAQLNDHLMAVTDAPTPVEGLDEWLKYMTEREADRDSVLQAIRAGHYPPSTVLENIRAQAAAVHSEAVATVSSSDILSNLPNISSSSRTQQNYGPTTEEILAALESRVQA